MGALTVLSARSNAADETGDCGGCGAPTVDAHVETAPLDTQSSESSVTVTLATVEATGPALIEGGPHAHRIFRPANGRQRPPGDQVKLKRVSRST